jgi:hypothetical protein
MWGDCLADRAPEMALFAESGVPLAQTRSRIHRKMFQVSIARSLLFLTDWNENGTNAARSKTGPQ